MAIGDGIEEFLSESGVLEWWSAGVSEQTL
jgi:hypothetical protein